MSTTFSSSALEARRPRRHRGIRGGRFGRHDLQIAAGQGAHGDGRRCTLAALANVDDRDNGGCIADNTRGGQHVNNWRMAERAGP